MHRLISRSLWAIPFGLWLAPAAQALDLAVFYQGVQRLQARVEQDLRAQDTSRPAQAYLRPHAQTRLYLLRPEQARGTVIAFHGEGQGPWQLAQLCRSLNTVRLHCYAPRLPGHGWMNPERQPQSLIPLQPEPYVQFLDQVYADVLPLQSPVYAFGISGGASLALQLATRHSIERVVAVSPLLGPDYPAAFGWPLSRALAARKPPLDTASSAEAAIQALGDQPDLPQTPVNQHQLLVLQRIGWNLENLQGSVQLLSSEQDQGTDVLSELLTRLGGGGRHGWFHDQAEVLPVRAWDSRLPNPLQQQQTLINHFFTTGERFWHPPGPPAWLRRHSLP